MTPHPRHQTSPEPPHHTNTHAIRPHPKHRITQTRTPSDLTQTTASHKHIYTHASFACRYVCGLREVRKAVKLRRAVSVVVAPDIEQLDAIGGLDNHLQEILDMWVHKRGAGSVEIQACESCGLGPGGSFMKL